MRGLPQLSILACAPKAPGTKVSANDTLRPPGSDQPPHAARCPDQPLRAAHRPNPLSRADSACSAMSP